MIEINKKRKSEMFDNYPQAEDYTPYNRPRHCKKQEITIMAGETAEHSFEVPFNIKTSCDHIEVIYKLGLKDVIIKQDDEIYVVITEKNTSLVSCNLSSEETSIFEHTLLNARVQLKFYMNDRTISYSEIYKIKLMNSLDVGAERPVPPLPPTPGPIIACIGYTED